MKFREHAHGGNVINMKIYVSRVRRNIYRAFRTETQFNPHGANRKQKKYNRKNTEIRSSY